MERQPRTPRAQHDCRPLSPYATVGARRHVALALALAVIAACSCGRKVGPPPPPALVSIDVAPQTASVPKGLTQAFTATGHYSDGSTHDLTAVATWTSSDGTIATLSAGVATGVAQGLATVTAAYGDRTGSGALTVDAPVPQSVAVVPTAASVAKGLTQTFTATAQWSDGTTSDVTGAATWTTLDPSVATATGSVAKGKAVGSTQVQATLQGVTGSASLTVTAAIVQAVTVSPAGGILAAGFELKYSATAVYSDDTKQDVTGSASWTSSNAAAASFSSAGLATGVALGATTISATFSGVTASTPLTVTSATLSSISISPTTPTVPVGVAQAFTASGTFSDGLTR